MMHTEGLISDYICRMSDWSTKIVYGLSAVAVCEQE